MMFNFQKSNNAEWTCQNARGRLIDDLKILFPNEEITYNVSRKQSFGPQGGISSVNKNPRKRVATIKFSDPANEAFFLFKYIAEQG